MSIHRVSLDQAKTDWRYQPTDEQVTAHLINRAKIDKERMKTFLSSAFHAALGIEPKVTFSSQEDREGTSSVAFTIDDYFILYPTLMVLIDEPYHPPSQPELYEKSRKSLTDGWAIDRETGLQGRLQMPIEQNLDNALKRMVTWLAELRLNDHLVRDWERSPA